MSSCSVGTRLLPKELHITGHWSGFVYAISSTVFQLPLRVSLGVLFKLFTHCLCECLATISCTNDPRLVEEEVKENLSDVYAEEEKNEQPCRDA